MNAIIVAAKETYSSSTGHNIILCFCHPAHIQPFHGAVTNTPSLTSTGTQSVQVEARQVREPVVPQTHTMTTSSQTTDDTYKDIGASSTVGMYLDR